MTGTAALTPASAIPRRPGIDGALPFLQDSYRFVSRTADRLGTDAFSTTLLGAPVVCLRGAEAAALFAGAGSGASSSPPALTDVESVPASVGRLILRRLRLGRAALPDPAADLSDLLIGSAEDRLAGIAREEFADTVLQWRGEGLVTLRDELPALLGRTALRWAGVPSDRWQIVERADEMRSLMRPATLVRREPRGVLASRRSVDGWARSLVSDARSARFRVVPASPLAAIADAGDPDSAAAERLLALIRPILAVSVFIEFAFLGLAGSPQLRTAFRHGDHSELDGFVTEVRRRTPFLPAVIGRAAADLPWRGATIPAGRNVVLDVFGTNHDPRLWPDPLLLDPARYREGRGDATAIVAQGADAFGAGAASLGESATQGIVAAAIRGLSGTRWSAVGSQDRRVRYSQVPARVASGLVLNFR